MQVTLNSLHYNKVLQLGKHACLYPMQVALIPCTKQGVQKWTLQIVLVSLVVQDAPHQVKKVCVLSLCQCPYTELGAQHHAVDTGSCDTVWVEDC